MQRPYAKLAGNFPLGVRLAKLPGAGEAKAIPKTPTHFLIRPERVRERPAADAAVVRTAPRHFAVRVTRDAGDWAAIAREGQELGYVPLEAVAPLQ